MANKTYVFKPVANAFTPAKGDAYFTVQTGKGNKVIRRHWTGDAFDTGRLAHNNVFRTFAAAHAVRKTFERTLKGAQR